MTTTTEARYTCKRCGATSTVNTFHDPSLAIMRSHPLLMGQTAERYCLPSYQATNCIRWDVLSKRQKAEYITNGR